MLDHNVNFKGNKPERQSIWTQLLVASFPILVIIAVFHVLCVKCKVDQAEEGPLTFGKSSEASRRGSNKKLRSKTKPELTRQKKMSRSLLSS